MTKLEDDLGVKTEPKFWQPPKCFQGETVFVIGGGPSILNFNIDRLKDRNCISVNNAHTIAPWSRYLVFHDMRWMGWHLTTVMDFRGIIVTTNYGKCPLRVERMRREHKIAINCTDPTCLAGIDSGTHAVNLAFHTGPKTIALVGFDMGFRDIKPAEITAEIKHLQTPLKREGFVPPPLRMDPGVLKHWHQEHPIPPMANNYDRFLAQYPNIIRTLQSHNVRLVSLTPTRIKIPRVKLSAIV